MSDKRRRPRICGICARIDMDDIDRKYCPIAAERIYYNKPADRCSFLDLIAADGGPASPKNSYVEFVLSENQFSPPIWTGEWINGILPDENIPGLVHIRIPREITKSLRRGSYMFSVRVSDPMKFTFSTQLKGNFLVEYMPTSDHRSIPYRDGTSEIFKGVS